MAPTALETRAEHNVHRPEMTRSVVTLRDLTISVVVREIHIDPKLAAGFVDTVVGAATVEKDSWQPNESWLEHYQAVFEKLVPDGEPVEPDSAWAQLEELCSARRGSPVKLAHTRSSEAPGGGAFCVQFLAN